MNDELREALATLLRDSPDELMPAKKRQLAGYLAPKVEAALLAAGEAGVTNYLNRDAAVLAAGIRALTQETP